MRGRVAGQDLTSARDHRKQIEENAVQLRSGCKNIAQQSALATSDIDQLFKAREVISASSAGLVNATPWVIAVLKIAAWSGCEPR